MAPCKERDARCELDPGARNARQLSRSNYILRVFVTKLAQRSLQLCLIFPSEVHVSAAYEHAVCENGEFSGGN
jgi:hypothetical protein